MKLAFNGATTMYADLGTDIRAASQAGFEFLEIWSKKLYKFLQESNIERLKEEFDSSGIRPFSINSIEHITFRSPEETNAILEECRLLSDYAASLGCPYIVIVPGKLKDNLTEQDIISQSAEMINRLADIAEPKGVGLAFEFLGQTDCSVQTLGLASEIVKTVNRDNVGLVIDTFHFYAGNSGFDSIKSLDKEKLFIFHINDAENLPKSELNDSHRLYPGEGILPIREIRERLEMIGWDNVASVEIFRPEYWQQDPFEVAKNSYAAAKKALGLSN
ncbi:MAG TPA: sugar phosphate isomerase/epimerase [Pyrinomonadaceae bacterium]|nr:sugar phosphate isomerase/epimerase [Pyrinomonadaceae bacterium]